jgi:Na+/H+ antiporter NhaD/arsenite permease-like protein
MSDHNALTLFIFIITYAVIALGKVPYFRIDRTGAAIAGAVAMIVCGAISEQAAEHAIDVHTLALLLGMMIVVANLRLSGAFAMFARAMLTRARSGFGILAMTIAAAGILAAFFINDVVCIALTPLAIEAAAVFDIDPVPLLLGVATASNIGSAATITGNPQNMIVAGFAHLGYASFLAHLAPGAIAGLVADYVIIAAIYRSRLTHRSGQAKFPPAPRVLAALMIKSSIVAAIVLVLFALGFQTDLVAMAAGAFLLFTRRIKPTRIYRLIDWTMLVMFAGLFIVVAGLETTGFAPAMLKLIGHDRLTNPAVLTVVVAALSNIVSNVPAVLLFRPLYPALGGSPAIAMLIASASTYAGNLTEVGSIANLIVIEQARLRNVEITFGEYLRVGVPITIVTLAINSAMLWFWPY